MAALPEPSYQDLVLAARLIIQVRKDMAPEAVRLQDRIDRCVAYLGGVSTPNQVTLKHVRRYLDGTYDDMKG